MDYPLGSGDLLLIRGSHSFILAGRSGRLFPLCIESFDDEICVTIEPDDLIAVSAPEDGPLEPAAMLLDLVRQYRHPLFVLPRQHPGSRRLRYVVSAGPGIVLACDIQRGTHPEQHLLCASEELSGIQLQGIGQGIRVKGVHDGMTLTVVSRQTILFQFRNEG